MEEDDLLPTSIPQDRVAEITTWGNNCALSCTSIFLVNNFLSQKLSARAKKNFTDLFNSYYDTHLNLDQLQKFFDRMVKHPADRQIIIGPMLRDFITRKGVIPERDDMLSNDAFRPLAEEFEFNVQFYAALEGKIDISGAIPEIIIDPAFNLTLMPYYHTSHYDLIMDTPEAALAHNRSAFEESNFPHSIAKEDQENTKRWVNDIAVNMDRQLGMLEGFNREIRDEPAPPPGRPEAHAPSSAPAAVSRRRELPPIPPSLPSSASATSVRTVADMTINDFLSDTRNLGPLYDALAPIVAGFRSHIEALNTIAAQLAESGETAMAEKATNFVITFSGLVNPYFDKTISEMINELEQLKTNITRLINQTESEIPKPSWLLSWVAQKHPLETELGNLRKFLAEIDTDKLQAQYREAIKPSAAPAFTR